MLRRWVAASLLIFAFSPSHRAGAEVLVRIDKSEQRMTLTVDGESRHSWPVSTGRDGFGTPNGRYRALWLARRWFSRKYDNSPMPHSVFFRDGYAIHGTEYVSRLGRPASHGCVRLAPANAATLYKLVQEHGKRDTRIVVTGDDPVKVARKTRKERLWTSERERRASAPIYRRSAYSRSAYNRMYRSEPVSYRVRGKRSRWRDG